MKKKVSVKLLIFSYPWFLAYVLGAQKNRLIEPVLLSTHNICFDRVIRKLFFCWYALLSKGMVVFLCNVSLLCNECLIKSKPQQLSCMVCDI